MFRAIALLSCLLMVRAEVPHHLGHYGVLPYYRSVIPVDETPKPYQFAYQAEAIGGASARQESADGAGRVVGSYSLSDVDGRSRVVDYVADEAGFRASVKTNEPGTKSESPADVLTVSSAGDASLVHTAADVYRGGLHRYGGYGGYGYPHGYGYLGHHGYRGLHGGYRGLGYYGAYGRGLGYHGYPYGHAGYHW